MKRWMAIIIYLIIFVVSLALIIINQRTVGPVHLLWMLVGTCGLIGLLYAYNRTHR